MKTLLERSIKQVIESYPAIGSLLEAYGVGCTTCSVGTCLLKDIVTIHGLTKEQELGLFSQIQEVLAGREPDLSKIIKAEKFIFIQPIQKLIDEHKLIKQLLKMIPDVCELILREPVLNVLRIEAISKFIREYADKYHHAKEEGVLFSFVDQNQEIIRVMYEDHALGRNYVGELLSAAKRGEAPLVINSLIKYQKLLTGHIQKEDEILYPWIQRQLSAVQQQELTSRCAELDCAWLNGDSTYKQILAELERETTGVV